MNRWQLSLLDLLWVTGLAACVVGAIVTSSAEIAWIGLACVLLFVWRRPVLLRFWTLAVIGIGTGLTVAGATGERVFHMHGGVLLSWGIAMIVGGVVGFSLFGFLRPPPTSGQGG